jgi:hypothetical protein
MNVKIHYTFESLLWQHATPSGWYFISLPVEVAREIRENSKWQEEGWGRLKATARIGNSEWNTAIWYDTKHQTYLLPIKAAIRVKELLQVDMVVHTALWI